MVKKGSITVFLALNLSLILSLVFAGMESVKMAAARTQILNSVDIGLYSLFGQYDKTLLDDFDLFFLDGSCGGGALNLASVYDNMESYIKPVLKQNVQKLSIEQGGFTGYRLATDDDGEIFYQQAVRYMKDTLGSQGVQLLLETVSDRQQKLQKAEENGENMEEGNALESYEQEMQTAESNSQAALEEMQKGQSPDAAAGEEVFSSGETAVKVDNPIPVIKEIRKMGILDLVLPSGKGVSDGAVAKNTLVSGRSLQKGMTMVGSTSADQSYASQMLFQQYLMKKLGHYQDPAKGTLKYQMEYLLYGKSSDMENLKEMAKKLLLIREGINFASLMADSAKRAQVQALAVAVASGFLIPPASVIIEAALLLCWSFGESILDVRELFAGGKVPLVKNASNWQLSLSNLPNLLQNLDSARKSAGDGMSYEDYLQVLLFAKSKSEKLKRGMDMVELSVRTMEGKENFRLDSCIEAIEVSFSVNANRKKVFYVTKQYCYS